MIYNVKCQLILNRSLDNVTIQVEVGENGALKSFWQVHSAQVVSFIVISIKFWNEAWIETASRRVSKLCQSKGKIHWDASQHSVGSFHLEKCSDSSVI